MKIEYDDLALIVKQVCEESYNNDLPRTNIDYVEDQRKNMTSTQINDFVNYCDKRYKTDHSIKPVWYQKLLQEPDQLKICIQCWLYGYLIDNNHLKQKE